MNEKILLIGSGGFLGKHVKKLLIKDKYNFIEISGKDDVDITNLESFDSFLSNKNIHTIINCSAFVGGIAFGYKFQGELLSKNSLMGINIYKLSLKHKIKRIINPISNCAYPGHLSVYDEKNFWDGAPHESVFNYALSKRLIVGLGQSYFEQYGVSTSNVILSNMYGPFDHFEEERSHALGAIVKKTFDAHKNGKKNIKIWGTGKPVREWLYITDGATSLVKAMELDEGNYLFNIGVNKGSSINEIAAYIASAFKWKGTFENDLTKPDGVMRKTVNGDYGKELISWSPEVKLEDGITETVEWYIDKYG